VRIDSREAGFQNYPKAPEDALTGIKARVPRCVEAQGETGMRDDGCSMPKIVP
jgi:hypothetical protein